MSATRHKFDWILLALALLAVFARGIAMWRLGAMQMPAGEDRAIAMSLLEHRGFSFSSFSYSGPTSCRAPVYPLMLCGVYALFGAQQNGTLIALSINALAGAVAVIAAYYAGRNLFQRRPAALLLALGIAICPTQLQAAAYQQGLSISVAGLMLMLAAITSTRVQRAPLAGVLAALVVLTESILVFPVAIVIAFIAARKPSAAIIALLTSFCIVTPWLYRNAVVHDELTGVTNNVWVDLFSGNGDNATGSHNLRLTDFNHKPLSRLQTLTPIEADQLKHKSESKRNDLLRRWSFQWISDHPLSYAKLCGVRIAKLIWLDWDHPLARNAWNVISRSVLLLGAIISAVAWFFRPRVAPGDVLDQPSQLHADRPLVPLKAGWVAIALALGLAAATAFTMAEARNAVWMDVALLLAIASMADTKRQSVRYSNLR